ncbi:MAG TPA: amidohydrolase family protein [Acidimicrobiales bacterium]|nr:amidohydrolase family protein [Acidimicrobiales bacterium]
MTVSAAEGDVATERVDTLINGAVIVTMNPDREVLADGAIALAAGRIVAVGTRGDLEGRLIADEVIDGSPFVVTPGLVNTHIHITGEPLTRGFVPDDTSFEENVFVWLCTLYSVYTAAEERLSAQLAAAEMLKSGTTTFLEAGTIRFLDAVVDGLNEIGIRGRVGRWVWDLPPEPAVYRQTTDEAIAHLQRQLSRYPCHADERIGAWSMVVGHTTCSEPLWRAAKALADEHGTGLNFHMSPAAVDPEGFLATYGRRPMEQLAEWRILDRNVMMAHCVHVDDNELALMAARRCNVAHCPTTALKVAYGVSQIGKMPEMAAAGINVGIGTDGNNASNYSDLMRATYLVAGLFKDARMDPRMFPAEAAFEMATLGGARGLLLEDEIGSLEVGKRADVVLHDRRRPEWTPLLDIANQLVYAADGRSVHTVFVGGRKVVDDYRLTTVDEAKLYADAQRAGEAIVARSGLARRPRWPVI